MLIDRMSIEYENGVNEFLKLQSPMVYIFKKREHLKLLV